MKRIVCFFLAFILLQGCKESTATEQVKPLYKVTNAGIGGNNTVDLLNRVNADVLSLKPTLVILMVGTNDLFNDQKLVPLAQYETNLSKLVKTIKGQAIQVLLVSPPPIDPVRFSDFNQIELVKGIMSKISQQQNCLYYDLNADMKTNAKLFEEWYLYDKIHPSKAGYKFIAQSIYNKLKQSDALKYYNIVCFGDSITQGEGVDSPGKYPDQLSALLNN